MLFSKVLSAGQIGSKCKSNLSSSRSHKRALADFNSALTRLSWYKRPHILCIIALYAIIIISKAMSSVTNFVATMIVYYAIALGLSALLIMHRPAFFKKIFLSSVDEE